MVNLLAKYEEVFSGFGYIILFPICLFVFCMILGLFRAIKQQGEKENVNIFLCLGIAGIVYVIGKIWYQNYPYTGLLACLSYVLCYNHNRLENMKDKKK